ncbi:hypothetical protein QOT17_007886 [Balamuthia mandrillaris]
MRCGQQGLACCSCGRHGLETPLPQKVWRQILRKRTAAASLFLKAVEAEVQGMLAAQVLLSPALHHQVLLVELRLPLRQESEWAVQYQSRSSELLLRQSGFTPQPQETDTDTMTPGLKAWNDTQESQLVFTEWSGKLVELQLRASKAWDVGLFHVSSEKPLSFHPLTSLRSSPHFVKDLKSTYNSAVILSVADFHVYRYVWKENASSGMGEAGTNGNEEVDMHSAMLSLVSRRDLDYSISVRIEGRKKGKAWVSFKVDNDPTLPFPAPPPPFALVFGTLHAEGQIQLSQQLITYGETAEIPWCMLSNE